MPMPELCDISIKTMRNSETQICMENWMKNGILMTIRLMDII